MRVFSFCRQGYELVPVEIELQLKQGSAKTHFLGLPDSLIRESVVRLQTAFKNFRFEWPNDQQVVVNLRPSFFKKNSRGMDLALAAALLWETRQLLCPDEFRSQRIFLYGEVNLKGKVGAPEDLLDLPELQEHDVLISGKGFRHWARGHYSCGNLGELSELCHVDPPAREDLGVRPENGNMEFPEDLATLMAVSAVGGHSVLLAGPAGGGKSTAAEKIPGLLPEPGAKALRLCQKINRYFGYQLSWLPVVQPHHSVSVQGMIGGGNPPLPGEITRAHRGVLLLDELLEFKPTVLEGLREPLESGRITISRRGHSRIFPCQFLMLATTNLCPCGEFVPMGGHRCRCLLNRRRRYLERLRGPFIDRFQMFHLTLPRAGSKKVSSQAILKRVIKGDEFRRKKRRQRFLNREVDPEVVKKDVPAFVRKNLMPTTKRESKRRYRALLQVARTLADLDRSRCVEAEHIQKATELCVNSFRRLKQYDS